VVGHDSASLGLTPGPDQDVHVELEPLLTFVEYSALPLLSLRTQSVVVGTHVTAFTLLPLSTDCE
jgi:hypothetical protein